MVSRLAQTDSDQISDGAFILDDQYLDHAFHLRHRTVYIQMATKRHPVFNHDKFITLGEIAAQLNDPGTRKGQVSNDTWLSRFLSAETDG